MVGSVTNCMFSSMLVAMQPSSSADLLSDKQHNHIEKPPTYTTLLKFEVVTMYLFYLKKSFLLTTTAFIW